jgi:hypothetical protein
MRDEAPAIANTMSVLDLIAEIGRLRAEIERIRSGTDRYWEGRWRDEKAENNKLRSALGELRIMAREPQIAPIVVWNICENALDEKYEP